MPEPGSKTDVSVFSFAERIAILLGAAVALVLGLIGYSIHYQETGIQANYSDILYGAVSLFIMQFYGGLGSLPWQLDIARWLAPASLSYAAAKAIAAAMHEKLAQLRINRLKGHAIVCGLDVASLRTLESMHSKGIATVLIVDDDGNKHLGAAKANSTYIVHGNPGDATKLASANLRKAAYLFAVSGDDGTNIEAAYHAFQQRKEESDLPALKCAIHIDSQELSSALYDQPVFASDYAGFSAGIFNHDQLSARWLLARHGPDTEICATISASDAVSVLLLGANSLLNELVLRFACIGHYGQRERLNVSIAGADATSRLQILVDKRPPLQDILQVEAQDIDLNTFNADACQQLIDEHRPDIIYVCADDVRQTLVWAQTLTMLDLACPVIVCDSNSGPIYSMLKGEFRAFDNFKLVNLVHASHHFDVVIRAAHDKLAMAIHQNYVDSQLAAGETPESNSSLVAWEELPETLKDANRNQADHLHIKCRVLTGKIDYSSEEIANSLTGENIERLAMMEHNRWMAEKLLAGWRYTAGEKNIRNRLSPSLLPWSELPESEREKDRNAVLQIGDKMSLLEKRQ